MYNFDQQTNGACVFLGADFSKSFGGKISHIWTDVSYRLNKKLAGKLKIFKQSMPWILGRQIKFQSPTKSRHTICSRLASSRRLWWRSLSWLAASWKKWATFVFYLWINIVLQPFLVFYSCICRPASKQNKSIN